MKEFSKHFFLHFEDLYDNMLINIFKKYNLKRNTKIEMFKIKEKRDY